MSLKTSKLEPVKGQTSVRCFKTKHDVKPSDGLRSPLVRQRSLRFVESSAKEINTVDREATKVLSSSCDSIKWTGNFILMVELRRKIIAFRRIIELPSLTAHLSITNMVMRTMKDLNKLCPEIVESSQIIDMRREEVDKLLDLFYNSLKSIGDSWIDDHEWIIKSEYRNSSLKKNLSDQLVEKVLAALDGLIKGMNERLNLTEKGNDETMKKVSPRSKPLINRSESLAKQLRTPKTLMKPLSKDGDLANSVSNLPTSVRMQTLVKLSPFDVKRLTNKNLCQKEAQRSNGDGDDESIIEKNSETERKDKMEKAKVSILEEQDSMKNQIDDKSLKVSEKAENAPEPLAPGYAAQPAPPLASIKGSTALAEGSASLSSQPPLPVATGKGQVARPPPPPPPPPPGDVSQPPLIVVAGKGQVARPPPPPGAASQPAQSPLTVAAAKGQVARPPPPPPGAAKLLPLPMAAGKGHFARPPPPPPGAAKLLPPPPPPGARGSMGAKKAMSKLRRSTQLGNLYRFLRAKLEGKNHEPRSRGASGGSKGGNGSASANGKQGMADALAEITKKSPYFQKIEEDVQMYMKSINVLKTEISKFQNKDVTELQKFHHYVESVLNKLEDETQVLARCEGFPHNKLDVIRMAAALYSKLQGMIKELKNWKIESPANQLLDKTERYFAKMRREIESLDQIKEEEDKKFKSHNIHFDFSLLVQIKELMVDISSGCMELALKEKREAKIASQTTAESREGKPSMKSKTACWSKMLWRAFQFAFRVYTFAGGQDDRADKLTKELAEEIELILKKNNDS